MELRAGECPVAPRGHGNANQTAWTSSCHCRAAASPHTPSGHAPKAQICCCGHWQFTFFYRKGFWSWLKKEGKKKKKEKKAEGRGPRDLRSCLNNGEAAAAGFVYVIKIRAQLWSCSWATTALAWRSRAAMLLGLHLCRAQQAGVTAAKQAGPPSAQGSWPQWADEFGFLIQKKQESSCFSPPKCSLCAASSCAMECHGNPINPIPVLAVPKPHPPALTPPPATRTSKLLFTNIFCSIKPWGDSVLIL